MPEVPGYTGIETDRIPRDPDGGVPVNVQDQITPPVSSPFVDDTGSFSISADTGESGVTSIVDTFEATAGHSISVGNEVLLLDTASNRDLYAVVLAVSTNTITIDRPIDHDFKSASTLGRTVTSEIKTDGSTTRKFFTIRSGEVPADIINICMNIECAAQPDDSKFGDQTALTRGLVLRINDSYHKTIYNFKKNGDFKKAGANVEYAQKAGGGTWSVNVCIDLKRMLGVALRVQDTDYIQIVNQDAQGVTSIGATANGHLTKGEV